MWIITTPSSFAPRPLLGLFALSLCVACTGLEDEPSPTETPSTSPVSSPTPTVTCNSTHESCGPGSCTAKGSPTMLPGAACINCHSAGNLEDRLSNQAQPMAEDLFFSIAGTAFADWYGSAGLSGATIEVTDATGKLISLTTNSVGNFYTNKVVTPPLSARILYNGQSRKMARTVDTGNCNACHACDGLAASKIYPPLP